MKFISLALWALLVSAHADELDDRREAIKKCYSSNDCTNLSGQEREYVTKYREIFKKNQELKGKWARRHPEWKDSMANESNLNFLLEQNDSLKEAKIKLANEYCRKNVKSLCLPQEKIRSLNEEHDKYACGLKRQYQLYSSPVGQDPKLKAAIVDQHSSQWEQLQDVSQRCDSLLQQDRERMGISFSGQPGSKEKKIKVPVKLSLRNFKPETCVWDAKLPRKIFTGPPSEGCSINDRPKLCSGFVVCDNKSADSPKVARLSTCSAQNCGPTDTDAVNCTLEQGYHSADYKESVAAPSSKSKKSSSGASRQ